MPETSERRIEYVSVDDLPSDPRNPKSHSAVDIEASYQRFGAAEPILLDERTGQIVAGHGRRDALIALRAAESAPPDGVRVADDGGWLVPVVRGWASRDDAEAIAYVVASNRLTEKGGWIKDPLAEILAELADSELGLAGVGYDQSDLDDLLATLQEGSEVTFNPDDPYAGAGAESSYDDWAANYRNKQIRSMVLDYPIDDYAVVVKIAERARKRYGVESNAELFSKMLLDWESANAPAEATAKA